MAERRLYLDAAPGETRGVVTLGGRPERLLLERPGDSVAQRLGSRVAARVSALDRANALAFVDLGEGPAAVLNLTKDTPKLREGELIEVEIRSEARSEKGAATRYLGPAQGKVRVIESGPDLAERLQSYAPGAAILTGDPARDMADIAHQAVVEVEYALAGGGRLTIEPTRALVAVDVDLGGGSAQESKRAARAANLTAIAEAARLLRLKGLGGLVVMDLVGRGHDPSAMTGAARVAFGPDNPGVAIAGLGRFGTLELTVPRRARPVIERLIDARGAATLEAIAGAALRGLEREAAADRGARLRLRATPDVVAVAERALGDLTARFGARLSLAADPAVLRERWVVEGA